MKKQFPTYTEFLIENELPIWAKPTQDIFNKSDGKYTDAKQHLNRFVPGDTVYNIVSEETKGMVGVVISLEGIKATVRYQDLEVLKEKGIDIPFDRDYNAEELEHVDGVEHLHDYTGGKVIPVTIESTEEQITEKKSNDELLTKLEDYQQMYQEDGANAKSATASAHDKLKKEIGSSEYKSFVKWLDDDAENVIGDKVT
jgi:hypothetical protein